MRYFLVLLFTICVISANSQGESQPVTKKIKEAKDPTDILFSIIENPPKYPDCEGDKEDLKRCFSSSIGEHIGVNFNANLPSKLGLTVGKKRMYILFTINKLGKIEDIDVRGSPHSDITNEVVRILNILPTITPGNQRGKPVRVKYGLPFSVNVQ